MCICICVHDSMYVCMNTIGTCMLTWSRVLVPSMDAWEAVTVRPSITCRVIGCKRQ
jgi:hypothetical protein